MAFPQVTINQTGGASGRPSPGNDYISGIMFYGTAPSSVGFPFNTYTGTPSIKARQLFSDVDATNAGIVPYTDNTAATGIIALTKGSTGDTITIKVTVPTQNGGTTVVNLGTYTQVSGDSTDSAFATSVKNFINAGTLVHGFSATSSVANLTLIAPKSCGVSLNGTTSIANTIVGTITATITTQLGGTVAGTASNYASWFYQISEFFRVYGTGASLWVGIITATSGFNEIVTLQNASGGTIKQMAIFDNVQSAADGSTITTRIASINTIAKTLSQTAPFIVEYAPNLVLYTDISTLPDQNLNTANTVRTVISQDGLAKGALLFVTCGYSVQNLGAKLATTALCRISGSDAQPVPQFDISDGTENNTPALANGKLNSIISPSLLLQLNNYNYTFNVTFPESVVGTYWNDNRMCISNSSDYAYENDNRVYQKASRLCRQACIPLISSELIFNADGTLSTGSIMVFQNAITENVTAGMITGFGSMPLISGVSVSIDPKQNVKATSNINIVVTINENGIARYITISLGF